MNCAVLSHSVMADSATPWTAVHQAVCPWNSPDKNTIVGCHFLLQGIFLTQGSNPCLLCLLHCRQILYHLSHQGRLNKQYLPPKIFPNLICKCELDTPFPMRREAEMLGAFCSSWLPFTEQAEMEHCVRCLTDIISLPPHYNFIVLSL